MDLAAYLERIGYERTPQPDLETLVGVHRAHLLTITYENLDIHLGRTLSLDMPHIFDKLVTRRRGGWCYEMNGLLAWALREIGFEVTMLASAVGRQTAGANAEGNHLILRVQLDRPYLADVGFGNGLLEPIPLEPGEYRQGFLTYRLENTGDEWVFHNHVHGGAGFEFNLKPHQMADFAERCHYLQTSPDSGFVRTAVCHRHTPDGLLSLRGATLRTVTADGMREHILSSADAYRRTLEDQFDLHLSDEVNTLWEKVWASHLERMQSG
jgi:N-hydroxyarylamine O-acetyltransferase